MNKLCPKCQIEKSIDQFSKNKNKKDGLQQTCKACVSQSDNRHYIGNKQKRVVRAEQWKAKERIKIDEYKRTLKCSKCSEDRWYVIDFHHLDPSTKEDNVSNLMKKGYKAFMNEVNKCIPLCRNCHASFHYHERLNGLTIQEYLSNASIV